MNGEDVMEVEVYKERRERWKRGLEKRRNKTKGRALGEESEQFYFFCKLSLLRSSCVEPDTHLFLNINLILPCSCPRAGPIVVFSLGLQILLVWAIFERHNPLF